MPVCVHAFATFNILLLVLYASNGDAFRVGSRTEEVGDDGGGGQQRFKPRRFSESSDGGPYRMVVSSRKPSADHHEQRQQEHKHSDALLEPDESVNHMVVAKRLPSKDSEKKEVLTRVPPPSSSSAVDVAAATSRTEDRRSRTNTMSYDLYNHFRPLDKDVPGDHILPFLDFGRKLPTTPLNAINSIEGSSTPRMLAERTSQVPAAHQQEDDSLVDDEMDVTVVRTPPPRRTQPLKALVPMREPIIDAYLRKRMREVVPVPTTTTIHPLLIKLRMNNGNATQPDLQSNESAVQVNKVPGPPVSPQTTSSTTTSTTPSTTTSTTPSTTTSTTPSTTTSTTPSTTTSTTSSTTTSTTSSTTTTTTTAATTTATTTTIRPRPLILQPNFKRDSLFINYQLLNRTKTLTQVTSQPRPKPTFRPVIFRSPFRRNLTKVMPPPVIRVVSTPHSYIEVPKIVNTTTTTTRLPSQSTVSANVSTSTVAIPSADNVTATVPPTRSTTSAATSKTTAESTSAATTRSAITSSPTPKSSTAATTAQHTTTAPSVPKTSIVSTTKKTTTTPHITTTAAMTTISDNARNTTASLKVTSAATYSSTVVDNVTSSPVVTSVSPKSTVTADTSTAASTSTTTSTTTEASSTAASSTTVAEASSSTDRSSDTVLYRINPINDIDVKSAENTTIVSQNRVLSADNVENNVPTEVPSATTSAPEVADFTTTVSETVAPEEGIEFRIEVDHAYMDAPVVTSAVELESATIVPDSPIEAVPAYKVQEVDSSSSVATTIVRTSTVVTSTTPTTALPRATSEITTTTTEKQRAEGEWAGPTRGPPPAPPVWLRPLANRTKSASSGPSPTSGVSGVYRDTLGAASYLLALLGLVPLVLGIFVLVRQLVQKSKKKVLDESEYSSEYNRSPLPTKLPRLPPHINWESEKVTAPVPPPPNANKSWEFPREKLRLQTVLGQGNFGQVWKAEADDISGHEGVTRLVAVKKVKEGATAAQKEDLLRELGIMQQLGAHPNVVTLLGCSTEKEPYLLIMEYVMYGKMLTLLREHKSKAHYFSFAELSSAIVSRDLTVFAYCIARGMEYIVSKGIIHRDLAARNILVDHNKMCKIADFGMSRNLRHSGHIYEQRSTKGALPIRWMAPESLELCLFTHQTDVWSFGILVWEIITLGGTPYARMGGREVMRRVREGYRLEKPAHTKGQLYRIASDCWAHNPARRPNFSDLKQQIGNLLTGDGAMAEDVDLDQLANSTNN